MDCTSLIVELYANFENRVILLCVSFRISIFVDNTHAHGLKVLLGKRTLTSSGNLWEKVTASPVI